MNEYFIFVFKSQDIAFKIMHRNDKFVKWDHTLQGKAVSVSLPRSSHFSCCFHYGCGSFCRVCRWGWIWKILNSLLLVKLGCVSLLEGLGNKIHIVCHPTPDELPLPIWLFRFPGTVQIFFYQVMENLSSSIKKNQPLCYSSECLLQGRVYQYIYLMFSSY